MGKLSRSLGLLMLSRLRMFSGASPSLFLIWALWGLLSFRIGVYATVPRYYGGWADKIHGKTIEVNDSKLAYTRVEPYVTF